MKRAVLLLIVLALACQKQEAPKPAARKTRAKSASTAVAPRTDVGDTMPPYSSAYLDGKPFDLAADGSKLILLNVWATWCGPCRAELPELQALHDKFESRGFKVVGVSIDESDAAAVKQFVDEHKVRYPIVFDAEGRVANILQTTVLPTSVILDRDRRILWRKVGALRPNDVKHVDDLIAKHLGPKKS